ncbi:MAG: hypothetical protein NTY68_05620 [Candidatus Micrarchaeota archaeon]|nr:hypothetical protein [Candidatus Micrarchaeota archaeon]
MVHMHSSSTFSLGHSGRRQRKEVRRTLAFDQIRSSNPAKYFNRYHSLMGMRASLDSIDLEIIGLNKRIRQLNGEHIPNAKNPLKSIVDKIGAERTYRLIKSENPASFGKFGAVGLIGKRYFDYENHLFDLREKIRALEEKRKGVILRIRIISGAK